MVAFYIKLVIFIGIGCYSIFNVRFPSYFYVKPGDGLNLRSEANINSARLTTIKKGEEVSVTDNSLEETQLNGLKGKWLKVKYNSQEGFIFSAYLDEESGTWKFIWKNKLSLFGFIVFLFGFLSTIKSENKGREKEEKLEEIEKLLQEDLKRRDELLAEYARVHGKEVADAMRKKEPKIGMDQFMIQFMFREPHKINVSETINAKVEEFCYEPYEYRKQTAYKKRFIFENGILKEYKIDE